jgi:hypothetical protein
LVIVIPDLAYTICLILLDRSFYFYYAIGCGTIPPIRTSMLLRGKSGSETFSCVTNHRPTQNSIRGKSSNMQHLLLWYKDGSAAIRGIIRILQAEVASLRNGHTTRIKRDEVGNHSILKAKNPSKIISSRQKVYQHLLTPKKGGLPNIWLSM